MPSNHSHSLLLLLCYWCTIVGATTPSSSTGVSSGDVTVVDPDLNTVAPSIHYVAFASQWISIPGSLFIIVYTWVNRKEISQKGPAHRFPLYISIADIGFTTTHFIDHMIVLNTHHYPSFHVCHLFSWFFQFMSIATIMNVMSVSLYCAYTVTYLKKPDVGKYDWKLLAWGFGIPFIFSFVPFMTNSYGHDAAWCWIDQTKPDSHLGYIVIPYLFFLVANVLILCVIFYRLAMSSNNTKTNMVKRSVLFVLAYIFQFTPIIVFSIQVYIGADVPYNTILFVVFNTNLGGFLNVIVYGFGILNLTPLFNRHAATDSRVQGTRISMHTPGGHHKTLTLTTEPEHILPPTQQTTVATQTSTRPSILKKTSSFGPEGPRVSFEEGEPGAAAPIKAETITIEISHISESPTNSSVSPLTIMPPTGGEGGISLQSIASPSVTSPQAQPEGPGGYIRSPIRFHLRPDTPTRLSQIVLQNGTTTTQPQTSVN